MHSVAIELSITVWERKCHPMTSPKHRLFIRQRQYRYHTISTEYVVILKFSTHAGDVRSGIIILEKSYCSGERRVGRSGTVSHRGIWQHSYYKQWHAVLFDVHGIFTPKPVHLCCRVPPCVRQWRQHSAPLYGSTHACRPFALWSWKRDSSLKSTFLHRAIVQQMCLPTHLSRCCRWALVRSNPRRGRCARELASLSRFPKVWSDIRGLNKQSVSSAVAGTGLTRSGVEMKNPDIT